MDREHAICKKITAAEMIERVHDPRLWAQTAPYLKFVLSNVNGDLYQTPTWKIINSLMKVIHFREVHVEYTIPEN